MAKEHELGPPGPFPEGPLVNLGASFGQPATREIKPNTVTIIKTGGQKEQVPVENVGGGKGVILIKPNP